MRQSSHRFDFLAVASFLVPLVVYSLTLCRGVFVGDSAELALAAAGLQIAHPPGYPFLTLVGNVWSKLVFLLRPIVALNLLSACFAAAASYLAYRLLCHWMISQQSLASWIAILIALAFAFSRTLWSVATSFEVYALSASLTLACLFCSIKLHHTGERRFYYLMLFLFGLGLANHLSILALFPLLVIQTWRSRSHVFFRDHFLAFGLFALALSTYLYLPLRAAHELVLSWYNPQSWIGFRQHVLAESYQRFLAAPAWTDIGPYFVRLWRQLAGEFALPLIIFAVAGLVLQLRRDRPLAFTLFAVLATNLALNFSYTIADIAPYFLPSIVVACIWLFELCAAFLTLRQSAILGLALAAVLCGGSLLGNWTRCDISRHTSAETYARDLIARVPAGGLLLCGSDNSMFPSLYLRYVEEVRPDCEVSGHLPTLTHLRRLLGYSHADGWTHFRNLVNFALDSTARPVVMARELMNFDNDYPRLRDGLLPAGLVYVADSALLPTVFQLPRSLSLDDAPRLSDPKEIALYAVYALVEAEIIAAGNSSHSDQLYSRIAQLVLSAEEPSIVSALAAHLIDSGKLARARSLLELVMDDPALRRSERLQLLGGLGHVALRLEDRASAVSTFERVLALDPSNVEARFQLLAIQAAAALDSRDLPRAITLFEQLHSLAPDHAQVSFQLGVLYAQTENRAAAITALRRCVAANFRAAEAASIISELEKTAP